MADRRRRTIIAATAMMLAGIVFAGALWIAADLRRDAAIESLARAPVGCETALSFEAAGDYVLYVETAGQLAELPGDCDAARVYERGEGTLPPVELELRTADGVVVMIEPSQSSSYDAGGYRGTEIATATIGAPGAYVVSVRSSERGFAVAIGDDPGDSAALLRIAAMSCLVAGLLIGGILLMVAARSAGEHARPEAPSSAPVSPQPFGWTEVSPPPTRSSPIHGEPLYTGEALRPPAQRAPWAPPVPPQEADRAAHDVGGEDQ